MAYLDFYSHFYNLRVSISRAVRDLLLAPAARWYLLAILGLQLLAWTQAGLIFRALSGGFLILHYNVSQGVDLVGEAGQVFRYPLFGLGVALVNLAGVFLARRSRDYQVSWHLLLAAAIIFNVLISAALFSIYLTNFRY